MNKEKHQDYFYINENYYKNPKETFIFLSNIIVKDYNKPKVLDLGCARGEFLFYLKNKINYEKLLGIDYSEQLINEAKKFEGLSDVELKVGSADSFYVDEKFDIIIMSGVLSYFDDTKKVFEQLKLHLAPGGKIIILGVFNEYDVDIMIKYRNNKYFNSFEKGWNIHSLPTIKKELKKLKLEIYSKSYFDLSFKSTPKEDPCRSWNIETEDGMKFTNGLKLIYDMTVLEIKGKQ